MTRKDCYKCDIEPSMFCGECPLWLGDGEASDNERVAYREGRADALEEIKEIIETKTNPLYWIEKIIKENKDD